MMEENKVILVLELIDRENSYFMFHVILNHGTSDIHLGGLENTITISDLL